MSPRSAIGVAGAGEGGFALVEMLVAITVLAIIMGATFTMLTTLSSSTSSTRTLTSDQEGVHTALRLLESDVASADPLVLVPASFTLDPSGTSNPGPYGTGGTDVVAMQEGTGAYDPCPAGATSTTTSPPPSPYLSAAVAANVVWAFDPSTGTLARYSWCSPGGWTPGVVLRGLADPAATTFQAVQDGAATPRSQLLTPSSTTLPNQGTPLCATSLRITLLLRSKHAQVPFRVSTLVEMPNQLAVEDEAC